jgi:hypothetical protein
MLSVRQTGSNGLFGDADNDSFSQFFYVNVANSNTLYLVYKFYPRFEMEQSEYQADLEKIYGSSGKWHVSALAEQCKLEADASSVQIDNAVYGLFKNFGNIQVIDGDARYELVYKGFLFNRRLERVATSLDPTKQLISQPSSVCTIS